MVPSSRRPQETPASATPNPQWHPPLSSLYMLCMPSSPSGHKIQKQMEATSIYIELPIYYGTKEITISFHPVGHHKTWKGWAYWSNGTSIPKPPTSSWCETNSQKKKNKHKIKKILALPYHIGKQWSNFRTSVVSEQLCYNTKKLLRTTCLPCSQGHEACNMPWQWVHFMCGNHCYMLLIYLFYSKD